MFGRRTMGTVLAGAVVAAGAVLVAPGVAGADGDTSVPVHCTGIPIVGSLDSSATVTATDDVDPVLEGGTVVNTLHVPIPVDSVPISVTVTQVKLTVPVPTGVTVTGVSFTPSSFTSQTWALSGGNLVATLSGSVPVGPGAPAPTVPDVSVTTTVAGPPRTVEWQVPSSITADADAGFFGTFTASCAPTDTKQVLISTTVASANQAPTATDETVSVPYDTATPITLTGTDPDSDPLTFQVTSSPAHGQLTGTAPNLTYTPTPGYVGGDSFTFTASDGDLSDPGTITLDVLAAGATVPGAPAIGPATAAQGAATVTWTPPGDDGGSAVTAYVVTAMPAVATSSASPVVVEVPAPATSGVVGGLVDGQAYTFTVAAKNGVGTGPASSASNAVTPRWWLPWSSGTVAVTELYTWLTGAPPSSGELALWLAALDGGGQLPGDLVAFLRDSYDGLKNVDPVARLYSAYFLRIPDTGGLNFWITKRRAGWSMIRISDYFAKSTEFNTLYGSLTNRQFVEQIYLNVLGRPGDQPGIDFWTAELNARRRTRGKVMLNYSESDEYKATQSDDIDAAVAYIQLLDRSPSTGERDAFADALGGGSTVADQVRILLHRAELAARAG